jgi:outer membrane protein assembly factor BamD
MTTNRGIPMTSRHILLACALAAGAVLPAAGCGGRSQAGSVEYSVNAQQNYLRGLKQLERKDWVAAAKYFAFIKARFPYSKFAVLAELRLADAELGAEQYPQATDDFKMFIKFHPTHEMVVNGYAAFRIAEAYGKQLPGDWWILPPSYEKDQTSAQDAEKELRSFVRKYPGSPFLPRARKMLADVSRRLAQHEWYVARYYWERGKPMGTVLRLRHLLDSYSGVGYDGDALWLLGNAYVKVNMPGRARDVWSRLVKQYPRHPRAGEAQRALAGLRG